MKKIKVTDYLFNSSQKIGQKEIYHYTSVESLFHIINSRVLRLCSTEYMNDSKELKIINDLTNKAFLEKHNILYDDKRVEEIKTLLNENYESFIISFSKHRDLLSQWRGYADNSSGVSIGFDVDGLVKLLNPLKPISAKLEENFQIGLKPVIYDIDTQCETISINVYKERRGKTIGIYSTPVGISFISNFFKSDGFDEEGEVRIVYSPLFNADDEYLNCNGSLTKLEYFVSNGSLRPYFGLTFDPSIITSITIGPNSKLTEKELKRFLISKVISIKNIIIDNSSISYRI